LCRFKSDYKHCFGTAPPPPQELLNSRQDIAETKQKLDEALAKAKECRQRGDCSPQAMSGGLKQENNVKEEVAGEIVQERTKSGVFIEVDPFTPHYSAVARRTTSASSATPPTSKSVTFLVALMTALLASLLVHAFRPL